MGDEKREAKMERGTAFNTRLCPLLSISGLRQTQSNLVGLGGGGIGGGGEAVACQGPACMMFQPIADESGIVVDAKCSLALTPMALAQVAGAIHQAFNKKA